MDVYSFVNSMGNSLATAPPPPGNAIPSYAYPEPLNPVMKQTVGPSLDDFSWSTWLDASKKILSAPYQFVESASSVVSNAGQKSATLVRSAVDTSIAAVTGTVGVVKWVVVGLVAFAVLYGLFLLGPAISGLSAPLAGGRK